MVKKKNPRRRSNLQKTAGQKSPSQSATYRFSGNHIIALAVIGIVTFLVFSPILDNGYVNFDDATSITNNPYVHKLTAENIKHIFTTSVLGGYIPLTVLSYAIENQISGLDPAGVHLHSLILHLLGTGLVFWLLVQLRLSLWGAAFAALLYGIHPMRVESVAWATERKDVLYAFFYLGSLCTYLLYLNKEQKRGLYFGLSLFLFTLSLFAKIQAVAFPLSLLLFDYYSKRPFTTRVLMEKIPFFILSLIVGLIGINFLESGKVLDSDSFSLFQRLLIGAYALVAYLIKWLFPFKLSPVYPYPQELSILFYLAPVIIGLLAFGVYRTLSKTRTIAFGVGFFAVNVMFMLQVLGAGVGFMADRYTYIGYLGLFFLLGIGVDQLVQYQPKWKPFVQGAMVVYLGLLAVASWRQCDVWQNSETLWTHTIEQFTGKVKEAHINRGNFYRDSGENQKALEDYNLALAIDSTFLKAYNNRSVAFLNLQQYDQALQDVNQVIRQDSGYLNAYINRAAIYLALKDFGNAVPDYNRYLDNRPSDAKVYYLRGVTKQNLGQTAEALNDLNEAIRLNPRDGNFYHNRAYAYKQLGNKDQALRDALKAQALGVRVDPGFIRSLD